MIFLGPLLLIVDLIAHVYHLHIAHKYRSNPAHVMPDFHPPHDHTQAFWALHPIQCIDGSQKTVINFGNNP